MIEIIKRQYNFLYKIYYYYDIFSKLKLQSCEEIKMRNVKCETLEQSIFTIIDVMKDYILKNIPNVKDAKIEVKHYDKSNELHIFIEKIYNQVMKKEVKIDIKKSVFIMVYHEGKIIFVGQFMYENLRKVDIDYYDYINNMRKLNSK